MNLALHPDHGPFTLEKWYIDVLLDDGAVLLIYLARMRLFGVPVARVTVELFEPDGSVRRASGPVSTPIEGSEDELSFGPARVEGGRLVFALPGLRGTLDYSARLPPPTLRAPFLSVGERRLDWVVEVPDADVVGHVEWEGGRREVRGRGYRDHVWFDLLPWRFPIRTLTWGRGVTEEHAAMWVEARLHPVHAPDGQPISAGWRDGAPTSDVPQVGSSRVMLDAHVVDLDGLGFGVARPALRLLTGDPHETKYTASISLGGQVGPAVHEVVTWR